jgi:hypothetical protein
MPRNFKESLLFTCLMCGLMVFGMSIWNLLVAGHFSWKHVLMGYLPGFVVAFLLDVIIVGPIAKKIALAILEKIPRKESRLLKVFMISGCMVLSMVTFMSLYGLLFNQVTLTWGAYGQAWLTNFVLALPLNLIIIGPISRFILGKLQKISKLQNFALDKE